MKRISTSLPMNYEVGAMMCKSKDGSTVLGTRASGNHDNVSVPYNCPPNSEPYGVWHTHPHGIAHPSDEDIAAGREFGLKRLCVTVPQPGETNCTNL